MRIGLVNCRSLNADLSVQKAGWPKSVNTLKSMRKGMWLHVKMESKGRMPHASTCSTSHRDTKMKSICPDPCLCIGGASPCCRVLIFTRLQASSMSALDPLIRSS
jgi:hypothetical protein